MGGRGTDGPVSSDVSITVAAVLQGETGKGKDVETWLTDELRQETAAKL